MFVFNIPIGISLSSAGKESACSTREMGSIPGSIPGSRRSPGEGNGYPLQYSCLENFMDRGAWWAAVHGVAESGTNEVILLFNIPINYVRIFYGN